MRGNHGNVELINSRTEELLACRASRCLSVRACMRSSRWPGLLRFVSDVLGYINLLASYALYPTITNPSLVHARVCVCVCVDIFPAFPRERRQRKSEKYSHVLSGDVRPAMFAPLLLLFLLTLLLLEREIFPFSPHPSPFLLLPLPCVILCALKLSL